jgi:hypothetical protein
METSKIRKTDGIQPIVREFLEYAFETVPFATPVNAVSGSYTITSGTMAQLNNDDVVTLDGYVFTKKASPSGDFEFSNASTLATNISKLDDYTAVESTGSVVITHTVKGTIGNDKEIEISILEGTTAGGDGAGTEATVTLTAETFALIANGDTVEFDGVTYTKVASDAGDNEFVNLAGLIALIDATDDWGAVNSSDDILITATLDTTAFNGVTLTVELYRVTASGVDGTIGKKGALSVDASRIYVCTAENTIHDANWKRIDADLTTLA